MFRPAPSLPCCRTRFAIDKGPAPALRRLDSRSAARTEPRASSSP
ncbi:hypothetical protein [Lysobacter gummosus]